MPQPLTQANSLRYEKIVKNVAQMVTLPFLDVSSVLSVHPFRIPECQTFALILPTAAAVANQIELRVPQLVACEDNQKACTRQGLPGLQAILS